MGRFANLLSMRAEVNRCSIVCNPKVLAGKGQTVTPLRGVLFPLGSKRHWSLSCTSGSRSVSIASAVCLNLAAHSMGSLPGPACAYSGSRYIGTAVCLTPGPGCSLFERLWTYCSTSDLVIWQCHYNAPSLCDVQGQRGCRAGHPATDRQTAWHASNHVYRQVSVAFCCACFTLHWAPP